MRLFIDNKNKIEVFVAIFQLLKNWSSFINIHFSDDGLYIQSMEKSHICLADVNIKNTWFSSFDSSQSGKISVDSSHMAILMNYALKNESIEIIYDDTINTDKLFVNFLNKENKTSFDHFFELNLIDVDEDEISIPKVDYDVELSIESKKLVDLFSELNTFGQDLNIKCTETLVELNSNGDTTKLKINIPIDDLKEYAITEGETLDMSFSLNHLCKMCLSIKISPTINISISNELPMSLLYDLGDDSNVIFYIAPKVSDN